MTNIQLSAWVTNFFFGCFYFLQKPKFNGPQIVIKIRTRYHSNGLTSGYFAGSVYNRRQEQVLLAFMEILQKKDSHKKCHLYFMKNNKGETNEMWKKVLCTDETEI